ncbi:hypothetical protein ACIPY5_03980 [Microbacterium sp. NPDC089698]|uniref:hypothetical protein n=1 Tax=Microbacterium sp. NPDC089698 TaxID=3364200 RepID=UPI003825820B
MTEERRFDETDRVQGQEAAQAALDALPGIAGRRDGVIDRRRLGRILFFEAFVPTAAFVSWFLAQLARDPSVNARSLPTLALLVVMLMWGQLVRGLRERYGAVQALRGAPRLMHQVLTGATAAAFLTALVITFLRGDAPVLLVALGGVLGLGAGVWAWGAMRRDAGEAVPVTEHAEMNTAVRIATGCFGLGLALIAAVGPLFAAGGAFGALSVVAAVLAVAIAALGRFSNAVPAIGAAWRTPQWTAFAISVVITCVAPIPAFATPSFGGVIGGIAAGAILVLFVVAALWPAGPDA